MAGGPDPSEHAIAAGDMVTAVPVMSLLGAQRPLSLGMLGAEWEHCSGFRARVFIHDTQDRFFLLFFKTKKQMKQETLSKEAQMLSHPPPLGLGELDAEGV